MRRKRKHSKHNTIKWYQKLRDKYRLVIMNESTLEEKLSFKLSRLNVFIALGALSILLVFLTTYIIAFTPLREYIPGYSSVGLQKNVYELGLKTDSIEQVLQQKDKYISNLKNIITGNDLHPDYSLTKDTAKATSYSEISDRRSPDDSLLRVEVENQNKYALLSSNETSSEGLGVSNSYIGSVNFYCPLKGMIISNFNSQNRHFGIDVAAQKNEAIKAALSGTVVLANWTLEHGWVLAIQHTGNIITFYKHCSVLLKQQGDYVHAGEPVAIVGETGEVSSGPHMHFELWYNGSPVNPKDYISW